MMENNNFFDDLLNNIIESLKSEPPVLVKVENWSVCACPKCREVLAWKKEEERTPFCKQCGKMINWEGL